MNYDRDDYSELLNKARTHDSVIISIISFIAIIIVGIIGIIVMLFN